VDTLIIQSDDQAGRKFTSAETEVDEGYVRSVLEEQALRLRRSCGWSDDICSQGLEDVLNGSADIPGIIHQEDIQALQRSR
jgi:hypothetical protein